MLFRSVGAGCARVGFGGRSSEREGRGSEVRVFDEEDVVQLSNGVELRRGLGEEREEGRGTYDVGVDDGPLIDTVTTGPADFAAFDVDGDEVVWHLQGRESAAQNVQK